MGVSLFGFAVLIQEVSWVWEVSWGWRKDWICKKKGNGIRWEYIGLIFMSFSILLSFNFQLFKHTGVLISKGGWLVLVEIWLEDNAIATFPLSKREIVVPTGCPRRLRLFLIFLNKADDRAYEMLALGLLGSFWYVWSW